MTTTTAVVTRVAQDGVSVVIGNETKHITWRDLDQAADYRPLEWGGQSDKELAEFYRGIRTEARRLARSLRIIIIKVGSATGGATWHASPLSLAGEYLAGLSADYVLDEPHRRLAQNNADGLAESLRRRGYQVIIRS